MFEFTIYDLKQTKQIYEISHNKSLKTNLTILWHP